MMKRLLLIFCAFFLFSCRSQQALDKITVQYSRAESKTDKLSLDIYPVKNAKKLPVVVFVHGGAWILGDKATKIEDKVRLFNANNYVFVSVNYRLSSFFNTKVQYPSHPNDVADAVKWIYEHIASYGGDPENIVLMGHSAGAHIVSLLGTSEKFLPQRGIALNQIKGIISNDTEGYDVVGMGNEGVKIYRRIFGDNPQQWKEASPIANVSKGKSYPPFLLITRGENYRKEMASKFAEELRNSGTKVSMISADPYSHFEANNKIGTEKESIITPKILEFLAECFRK